MMPRSEIEEKALALPPDEREQLAGALIRSLEEEPLSAIDEAWLEVVENRYAAYKNGDRKGIPGEVVFDELREEMGRGKT